MSTDLFICSCSENINVFIDSSEENPLEACQLAQVFEHFFESSVMDHLSRQSLRKNKEALFLTFIPVYQFVGFNQSGKYESDWIISPISMVNTCFFLPLGWLVFSRLWPKYQAASELDRLHTAWSNLSGWGFFF